MNLHNPDESNPLLMPELVSAMLSAVGISLATAVLGAFHWLS